MKRRLFLTAAIVTALAGVWAWQRLSYRLDPPTKDLGRAASVTLYDTEAVGPHTERWLDGLKNANADVLLDGLRTAEHRESEPLWKGARLAVVRLEDGAELQLAVSYYGGFFAVKGQRGHWKLAPAQRENWDREVRRIVVEEFIPHRRSGTPATTESVGK